MEIFKKNLIEEKINLSLEIGGSRIKLGLKFKNIFEKVFILESKQYLNNPDKFVDKLFDFIKKEEIDVNIIEEIAISSTGEIDHKKGIIKSGHFLNGLVLEGSKNYNKFPIVEIMTKKFLNLKRCYVLNDGYVAGLASIIFLKKQNVEMISNNIETLVISLGTFPAFISINKTSKYKIKKYDSRKILVKGEILGEYLSLESNKFLTNYDFTDKLIIVINELKYEKLNEIKVIFIFGGLGNRIDKEQLQKKLALEFFIFNDVEQINMILDASLQYKDYKSELNLCYFSFN